MMAGQRVALVVPTLNEAESIGPALARAPRDIIDRILVVDGGSRDDTVARARAAGAEALAVGRGYGLACWQGAQAAARDCEIIAFMDGDGADRADLLHRLTDPIQSGNYDFVIAARARALREPGSIDSSTEYHKEDPMRSPSSRANSRLHSSSPPNLLPTASQRI